MSPYGMRMGALCKAATENLIKYVSVQKDITRYPGQKNCGILSSKGF
jgi:hypothetical protein